MKNINPTGRNACNLFKELAGELEKRGFDYDSVHSGLLGAWIELGLDRDGEVATRLLLGATLAELSDNKYSA